ncbi:hypothetical protein LguiA_005725 [Lonicera macranthoides]
MEEEGLIVRGRVVIDMRPPFRSVKDAVMSFGETVLVREIYGNKLKEMQIKASENTHYQSRVGPIATELEEIKQSLQKAKEEGNIMANYFTSLKQDVEQTKRELQQMKSKEYLKQLLADDPEIEELKSVENTPEIEVVKPQKEDGFEHFEKKRIVKFASPNLLAKEINVKKKTKRKLLMPFIGGIFSKKKGSQEADSPISA